MSLPRIRSEALFFTAMLVVALALGAALAHAFELPNKLRLPADDYFVVQQIYAGWNRLAVVILLELLALGAIVWRYRNFKPVMRPAALALGAVLAAQAFFWVWTFPANQATRNWTFKPDDWETLRSQWELSHAAGAAFQFLAIAALTIAILRRPT